MTSELATSSYKICLTWDGGRRKKISCDRKSTTLQELHQKAVDLVLGTSKSSSVLDLFLTAGPPNNTMTKIEIDTNNNSERLAIELVPHMSLIRCVPSATAAEEEAPKEEDDRKRHHSFTRPTADSSNQSKRARAAEGIVDLTEEDEEEDADLALAKRLQQEENTAAMAFGSASSSGRNALVPTTHHNVGDARDPTVVTEDDWIFQEGPGIFRNEAIYGKWLVFRGAQDIGSLWKAIQSAVASGKIHAAAAKVSTAKENSNGNKQHVICIYTSEARIDEVGEKLVPITKTDMSYKTDEATSAGIYSRKSGDNGIALKRMYWNKARPSLTQPTKRMTPKQAQKLLEKATRHKTKSSRTPPAPPRSLLFADVVVTVVGLTHNEVSPTMDMKEDITAVVLTRETNNAHDPNAIRVNFDGSKHNKKIGYVQKDEAKLLAPWIDQGLIRIDQAVVCYNRVGPSTIYIEILGRACEQAMELLAGF